MTEARAGGETDVWERRETLVTIRIIPYVSLAGSVVFALAEGRAERWQILVFAAVSAAWMYAGVSFRPRWERPPAVRVAYHIGLVALIGVQVAALSPVYGFFAFAGVLHSTLLPGHARFAGVFATSLFTSLSQIGGELSPAMILPYLAILAVNTGIASTLLFIAGRAAEQSASRKAMIAKLAEANERLETLMAENTGLQAQLLTQAREAGVAAERQRMAREIHDTLAQGLTGVVTQLQAAVQARHDEAGWRRHVDNATALARESLAEARRSVRAVRPEALERARLPEAVAGEARTWSERTGVPVEVVTTGDARPLHPEVEITLLRAAQEALANVAKHAAASRVGLTLSYMEDIVTLDVRDDGVGFDPRETREEAAGVAGGYGLLAMRQRVARLAGRLEVESEPGGGTAVSASVPAIPSTPAEPAGISGPPAGDPGPAPGAGAEPATEPVAEPVTDPEAGSDSAPAVRAGASGAAS
ncbi:sensor histidine kinase [Bailinhaonella thermotolerans]|uniref:Oxygen sensor histidine kinase NreB n=1 Tax=Bailinhaonella thermotolerans TaxID=1070861 RepID=A0A3A4AYP8_9ACTN|nr:sensor histidine kinase [Bailinhaonella thermotolerans]RJL34243.1 sensor histidine kinase [Bailinhaonella thermotolerans]